MSSSGGRLPAEPQIAGTPLYLAPEILDGHPASAASDLYSVGVLLYFLVTGDYPVRGRTMADVRQAHARGERVPLSMTGRELPQPFVDVVDETVKQTGAANTIVNRGQKLFAFNTDVYGTHQALRKAFEAGIHRATLLGTGGAARAAALVLKERECAVTVLARDPRKAERFAGEFGFASDALNQAGRYKGDLLINATSVGMFPATDECPVPTDALNYHYVFDMVYNPLETRLLREAQRESVVISGVEMFVAQAARQFELWTGHQAPTELMRDIVLRQLAS